jgi:hypothetical protein
MIEIKIDAKALENSFTEEIKNFYSSINKSLKLLSEKTHAYIVDKVQSQLKSRKDKYLEALDPPEQVEDGVWKITLRETGLWIEEGQEPFRNER